MSQNSYEVTYKRCVWEVLKRINQFSKESNNEIVKYKINLEPKFWIDQPVLNSDREIAILKDLYDEKIIIRKTDTSYLAGYTEVKVGEVESAHLLEMFSVNTELFDNLFNEYKEYSFDSYNPDDYVIKIKRNGEITIFAPLGKIYNFKLSTKDNAFKLLWVLATSADKYLTEKQINEKIDFDKFRNDSQSTGENKIYNALITLRNSSGLSNVVRKDIFQFENRRYSINAIVQID